MSGEFQKVAEREGESGAGPVVYVVATPIGNLDDMTPRARHVLANVDVIAAEDTRETRKLLNHFGIQGKRLLSYHDFGETERAEQLVRETYERGASLALVSDAGTPCISDPGYRLVAAAKARGIKVHPIPGPSALTALASAAGLPSDRLLFIGFPPTKPQALRTEIASWAAARASVVFFESTRRLERTLMAVREIYPEARVAIGRELTKLYEEIETVSVADALAWLATHPTLKGEASVMVAPGATEAQVALASGEERLSPDELVQRASREFKSGATLKELLQKYRDVGLRRAELYDLLLRAKDL